MENMLLSTLMDTDSYKFGQYSQYPDNMTRMFSYFESRGGEGLNVLFFGLQYNIKKYLTVKITIADVNEASLFASLNGVPFNYEGWMYIANDLDGNIPLRLKAVPEGMKIPKKNILISAESTDEKCAWIVNWYETALVRLWYPMTVATLASDIKEIVMKYENISCDDPEGDIGFKLNDFGSRGASSQETAMIGGASHLVSFKGSDNIAGVFMANKYYNCEMSGFSIAASEHSTITSWGRSREKEAYQNMIAKYGDGNVFACVSDSYDFYNAVDKIWGDELKNEILAMNAMLVVRPDSGCPLDMVMYALNSFEKSFGYTLNKKGYKVLNKVRVIQGDGIDINDVNTILAEVVRQGFSVENVNFGMGGGLLQKNIDRDTHRFAFKCSWVIADEKEVEVFKDPITDKGKKSKKGRLGLNYTIDSNGSYIVSTVKESDVENNLLETVFENGKIVKEYTFEEVRDNAKKIVLAEIA